MFELLKLQFWWYPPHFLRLGGCFKSQLKPLGWGCITVVESGIPSIAQGLSWETSHCDYAAMRIDMWANWLSCDLLDQPSVSREFVPLSCHVFISWNWWVDWTANWTPDLTPKKVPVPRQLLSGRENREMWLETMLCHWNLGSCKPSYDQVYDNSQW